MYSYSHYIHLTTTHQANSANNSHTTSVAMISPASSTARADESYAGEESDRLMGGEKPVSLARRGLYIAAGSAVCALTICAIAPLKGDWDPKKGQGAMQTIVACSLIGLLFAMFLYNKVSNVQLPTAGGDWSSCNVNLNPEPTKQQGVKLIEIYVEIIKGAKAFLWAEYSRCFVFLVVFGGVVLVAVAFGGDDGWDWEDGALTATAFFIGGLTSIICGYIGMMVAVESNARTSVSAINTGSAQWTNSFNTAFRAGGVMGYCLTGLSLLVMYALCNIFRIIHDPETHPEKALKLFECIAGFGLGGSSIAMFGRVGGGIYTKAADVGADLAGKVRRIA